MKHLITVANVSLNVSTLFFINALSHSIESQPDNRCSHCNIEQLLKHFLFVLTAMAAPSRAAITVSTVTLKQSKPHYQPDSRLSHSERAITQADAETQPETEWNEQAQTVQLLPDTHAHTHTRKHAHTQMQLVEKVVCCCLFLLNFTVRGGFQCTCSVCSVLGSFKAGNSNYCSKLHLI